MAKRQNYGFQKHQKEAKKQKKRDEKAEKKRARREGAEEGGAMEGGAESEEEPDRTRSALGSALGPADLDPALRQRLGALCEEGWDLWDRFDTQVRQRTFHPFVAADYQVVMEALIPFRASGLRFLEWGSATGVITIMADLLGFEAYGIEIDPGLVEQARDLARRTGSGARFTAGSFLPTGYQWKDGRGDHRLGTIGQGESGYLQLGMPLDRFDLVFGYPWAGEEAMMLDLMRVHGRPGARLLIHNGTGISIYTGGQVSLRPGTREPGDSAALQPQRAGVTGLTNAGR